MPRQDRIRARPAEVTQSAPVGLQPLETGGPRDAYLYVPRAYRYDQPLPLVLLLHGSGGHAHHGLDLLQHLAEEHRLILVAPASTDYTWDVIVSRYGPDVDGVNEALDYVFRRYAVDAERLAIGGFSDGASYALSLGLMNGNLFTHIIAFSPGFVASRAVKDSPRIFISHGTRDEILPISTCSRRIVPWLERAGLDVEYIEFEAGHRIPPEVARRAVEWLTEAPESAPAPHPLKSPESRPIQEG
jgi:predicted esterase